MTTGIVYIDLWSYICPKVTKLTKKRTMEIETIIQTGEQLSIRNLMGDLWRQLRVLRPSLSRDTVARAFSEPETDTKTLRWIRKEAAALLESDLVGTKSERLEAA